VKASGWLQSTVTTSSSYVPSLIYLPTGHPPLHTSYLHRRVWYCTLSQCYVCAICVFDVRPSSSRPRLPSCQI